MHSGSGIENRVDEFMPTTGRKRPPPSTSENPVPFSKLGEKLAERRNGTAAGKPIKLRVQTISEIEAEIQQRDERIAYWGTILVAGELSLVVGRANSGKSTMLYSLVKHLSEGKPFLGLPCRKTIVLYLALERNSRRQIVTRFTKWKVGEKRIRIISQIPPQTSPLDLCEALRVEIEAFNAELVIIDNLQNFVRIIRGNDYGEVSVALEPLTALVKNTNVHIVGVGHQGKTERDDGNIDVIAASIPHCRRYPDRVQEARRHLHRLRRTARRAGVAQKPDTDQLRKRRGRTGRSQGGATQRDRAADQECDLEGEEACFSETHLWIRCM